MLLVWQERSSAPYYPGTEEPHTSLKRKRRELYSPSLALQACDSFWGMVPGMVTGGATAVPAVWGVTPVPGVTYFAHG